MLRRRPARTSVIPLLGAGFGRWQLQQSTQRLRVLPCRLHVGKVGAEDLARLLDGAEEVSDENLAFATDS